MRGNIALRSLLLLVPLTIVACGGGGGGSGGGASTPHGDGTFAPATSPTVSVGNYPSSVKTADFNVDGHPDLVIANTASSSVSVLLGNGAGGFGAIGPFPAGTKPLKLAIGDFNTDGRPDAAVANEGAGIISILLNDGSGGLSAPTSIGSLSVPSSIVTADLNNDGHLDLVVGTRAETKLHVLLGNGGGGFFGAPQPKPFIGIKADQIAAGDVNGDGIVDLVMRADGALAVSFGLGAGLFTDPPTFLPVGLGFGDVVLADVAGGPALDILSTNGDSATVSVFVNNGAGQFSAAPPLATADWPVGLDTGDFDGDGLADLVVVGDLNDEIRTYRGHGNGQFSDEAIYAVGLDPLAVLSADFDADGAFDIAVTNSASSSVSILLGNTTP